MYEHIQIIGEQITRSNAERGKTFLPKKLEAPVKNDEKVQRTNQVSKWKGK